MDSTDSKESAKDLLTADILGENREIYYKVVAKLKGEYYSIYDGTTKYELGKMMWQKVSPGHRGGYYVYPSIQAAVFADMYSSPTVDRTTAAANSSPPELSSKSSAGETSSSTITTK